MIGYYDYTVILTYLSLLSAGTGIFVTLSGGGHPYIGVICLLLCGLCDAFDGKVASSKKDRQSRECAFGVQIDSLSDLAAFGVLPACIGFTLLRRFWVAHGISGVAGQLVFGGLTAVLLLYMLAALIRLAYFNVTEAERQNEETGGRKNYTGLPVTSAALIFPSFVLLQYIVPVDMTPVYMALALLTGLAFLLRFSVRKPGTKVILVMVGIGVAEFVALAILQRLFYH